MADLDTIESTSEARHAERIAALNEDQSIAPIPTEPVSGTVNPPVVSSATDPAITRPAAVTEPTGHFVEPDLQPMAVLALHKRLKERRSNSKLEGNLEDDASKVIEHLLSLIRYVMNSDGEIPRCTEATRIYLRQHLDF